jgi:HlyD family secretion protein
MSRRNGILLALGLFSTAALIAWAVIPAPIVVEIAAVTRGPFEQTVDEQAKTRIRDHYLISAPLAGELDRITLREGDDVPAGGVIAHLRPALPALLDARTELELRHRLEAAEAAKERADARVKQAEVAIAQTRLVVERSRKLAESKLIAAAKLDADELAFQMSERELETAHADSHVAQHDIDVARAALQRTRDAGRSGAAPEWLLRAPIAGRVLRVHQQSGGTVGVGTALAELGDPANLEVVVELLTTEAPQVRAGALVRLDNWGGTQPLVARVRRIEPRAFTKISALGVEEQRVNVLLDIVSDPREWSTLGEGYRLDAHIRVYDRNDALKVPTGALFRRGDQWCLFIVDGHDRARETTVEVGHRNEEFAELLSGAAPNDRAILYPSDALREGARVTPAVTASAAPDAPEAPARNGQK